MTILSDSAHNRDDDQLERRVRGALDGLSADYDMIECDPSIADTRLDVNGLIRTRLGVKKTSFASAEETIASTAGMRIGGVTPFGLPPDLPIWIDRRVADRARVIVGGGSRRCKVYVATAAFSTLPHVEIITDLARPVPAAGGEGQ